MTAQAQTKARPVTTAIGTWSVTRAAPDEIGEMTETAYGKLVLQDYWTLILDEGNRAVLLAIPNSSVRKVVPS
jgi:hypothetical protein